MKVIAEEMAEIRGQELGCPKERQVGVFTKRLRCAWGIAEIRARARSRAVRKPLVGCSRAQADRLIAGSCVAPRGVLAQGEAHLQVLDAMTWPEDGGARLSREARCGG